MLKHYVKIALDLRSNNSNHPENTIKARIRGEGIRFFSRDYFAEHSFCGVERSEMGVELYILIYNLYYYLFIKGNDI